MTYNIDECKRKAILYLVNSKMDKQQAIGFLKSAIKLHGVEISFKDGRAVKIDNEHVENAKQILEGLKYI